MTKNTFNLRRSPDGELTNESRANRARQAVTAWRGAMGDNLPNNIEDAQTEVKDLITDLCHLLDAMGDNHPVLTCDQAAGAFVLEQGIERDLKAANT